MTNMLKSIGVVILFLSCTGARSQAVLVDLESSATRSEQFQTAVRRLAFRPEGFSMLRTVREILDSERIASPEVLQKVNDLMDEASQAGGDGDALRLAWKAVTLLLGSTWNSDREYLSALQLRTGAPAIDSSNPAKLYVHRSFTLPSINTTVQYRIDLYATKETDSNTPEKGMFLATVAQGELKNAYPNAIPIGGSQVKDGSYIFEATITVGDERDTLATQVYLISSISSRYEELNARLAKIDGHEEAKNLAKYPFALAEAMGQGSRDVVSYDFPDAFSRSLEITAALEQGRDPVRRATGLQDRAYQFPQTGELIPYQLYVPKRWDGREELPLVVALHGANLDETNMLGRANGKMQELAEAYKFIVVAPLGYRLNSGYGARRSVTTNSANTSALTPEQRLIRQYSEQDVFNVMDLVAEEYPVDQSRIYLTGNSMGGAGTWALASTHPDRWTAIAPVAAGGVGPEDVPALKHIPIMALVGDRDDLVLSGIRAAIKVIRDGGVEPIYIEVPGGTHKSTFESEMPRIFEFFSEIGLSMSRRSPNSAGKPR